MTMIATLDPAAIEMLSAQAARGDREAFGELYLRYQAELLAYARRRVPSLQDAEDLAEQTFFKALRSIARKRPGSAFNVWLFHIAKNLIIDFYRTRRYHEEIDANVSTTASAEDEALREQLGAPLSGAIAALPPRQRTVIKLRFIEGLEHTGVAERLGCTAGAVRITQMRALRALRAQLEPAAAAL